MARFLQAALLLLAAAVLVSSGYASPQATAGKSTLVSLYLSACSLLLPHTFRVLELD
jgi:hypothetical protein